MNKDEKILLVDDEERLLTSLSRQLRGKFDVLTAIGGEQALEALVNGDEIAVVVCDMRMPGMTGVEVLAEFSKKSPTTTRIMLTGNASQDCAVEAINQSHVFGFLNKPCTADALIESIEEGMAHHRLLVREKNLLETSLAGSIKLLSDVVSLTDPSTTTNSRKISNWANILLPHLSGVTKWELDFTIMLAPLGQMFVPANVLARHKKGASLSQQEKETIAEAPGVGSRLLRNIPRMETISQAILYQNKNFDGSGFPNDSAKGDSIPVIARLLRILSALLEAVGNDEPSMGHLNKLYMREGWFDPQILDLVRQHLLVHDAASDEQTDAEMEEDGPIGAGIETVRTSTLREGHELWSDLNNTDGALLLSAGTILTQAQVEKIRSMSELGKLHDTYEIKNAN
mgnify:FL=1